MRSFFATHDWKANFRATGTSLLIFGASGATSFAQAGDSGLFISFNSADTVSLYDGTSGALLNQNFASVQSPIGLAIGPDGNLYVGSDDLSAGEGAGLVSFGINGISSVSFGTFASHADAGNGGLNTPQGLAFVGGSLYVADVNASSVFIYGFTSAHRGVLASSLPNDQISEPIGLNLGANNQLYIANQGSGTVLSYSGGVVTSVNSSVLFNGVSSTALGPDGKLYVLDDSSSSSGGIWQLSLADGSATKIVDYSSSPFAASQLVLGPDNDLYVSGVDLDDGEGEVLKYGLDGSGGDVFADTGFGTSPDYLVFVAPEPTTLTIAGLAIGMIVFWRRRSR